MTSPAAHLHRSPSGVSSTRATEWLGTAGWAAKGIVYLLIAVLALRLAFGDASSEQASKQGALQMLVEQPFGSFLLALVVIGLFCYAAYRLVTVVIDDSEGTERARHAVTHLFTAVAYGVIGAQGVSILLAKGADDANEAPRTWSARLMDSGPGTVVLVAVGIGLLAFAGYQLWKAFSKKFMEKLDCPNGAMVSRDTIEKVGMFGIAARAAVAALLGAFVLLAVKDHDPNQAQGLDGALRSLQQATLGSLLLALVALGLASFGVYSLISARCRRHAEA